MTMENQNGRTFITSTIALNILESYPIKTIRHSHTSLGETVKNSDQNMKTMSILNRGKFSA